MWTFTSLWLPGSWRQPWYFCECHLSLLAVRSCWNASAISSFIKGFLCFVPRYLLVMTYWSQSKERVWPFSFLFDLMLRPWSQRAPAFPQQHSSASLRTLALCTRTSAVSHERGNLVQQWQTNYIYTQSPHEKCGTKRNVFFLYNGEQFQDNMMRLCKEDFPAECLFSLHACSCLHSFRIYTEL